MPQQLGLPNIDKAVRTGEVEGVSQRSDRRRPTESRSRSVRRTVHGSRLDDHTREVGLRGVAEVRRILAANAPAAQSPSEETAAA